MNRKRRILATLIVIELVAMSFGTMLTAPNVSAAFPDCMVAAVIPGGSWNADQTPLTDATSMGNLTFYPTTVDQSGIGKYDVQYYGAQLDIPPIPGYCDGTFNSPWGVANQMSTGSTSAECIIVHETIAGLFGWTSSNVTGSTNKTLTNDATDFFPTIYTEYYPSLSLQYKDVDSGTINITWTGLQENIGDEYYSDLNENWMGTANNIMSYSVYRSNVSALGPWVRAGNSTAQVKGGAVWFNETGLANPATYWYRIAVNYRYPGNSGVNKQHSPEDTLLRTGLYGELVANGYVPQDSTQFPGLYVTHGKSDAVEVNFISPKVVMTAPADGAMGVAVDTNYSILFSIPMNTSINTVTVQPAPVLNGTWNWSATGLWYNYTGAAWSDLTKYYVNLTGFEDTIGNPLTGDMRFNFTTSDFTAPTSNVTGPATANALTFDVYYNCSDPSGVSSAELWCTGNGGASWVSCGIENPPTGTFSGVTVPADGVYGWYTAAIDSLSNGEITPTVGPGFIEFMTLVDTVNPLIGPTTADKLFVNNQGSYGGTPPPVNVTTNVSDDNLAVAGWGIRNENLVGNGTMYFRTDITYDVMPTTQPWDCSWSFINGTLVTADSSPNIFGLDVLVMGEVNGTSSTGSVLGNIMPEHYALFDSMSGNLQSIYRTNGTPTYLDDYAVTVGPAGSFRAYRYDEGFGYIATALNYSGPDFDFGWGWMALAIQPIVDGRYTVCVTAVDWAQNSHWTNEADGNPVITVDTVAPEVNTTVPLDAAAGVPLSQNIIIAFSETVDNTTVAYTVAPDPGNLFGIWSMNNTVLTITHDPFAVVTLYTVNVTAVEDLTGNAMVSYYEWSFTTGDFTPPTANAGPDQIVDEGTFVTFDGSASTDNVGITNYTWTFTDGIPITLYDVGPTYQFDNPGAFTVTLNVTDAEGNWNTDTMTVTVNDITDPVANAGPDQNVNEGTIVTFDGSASTDNVGVVNYTWMFTDGVPVTLYEVGPAYQFDNVGIFIVTLNVTDAAGNWNTDTMTVTVQDATAPTANAGPDQTADEGDVVMFDGSASTDNVGIINYTWTFTDGIPVTLYDVGPTYQFDNPGAFTVTLNVTDAEANWNTDTMTVTVNDITNPVANAGPDQNVNEGTVVTFDGSASTDNVGVVNFTWTFTDGVPVTLYDVGPTYQFDNPGTFTVTLNVTDAAGNWHTDTMTVTVLDITNPVANAGPDQNVNEGTVVTFDGSASTDNVGVVNFTWTFTDGVPVTLYEVGPAYQFNNVGVFIVTLNVTDAAGNWHTDTMAVFVQDATAPTANAGPDQTVDEGDVVTFDGSASTDNVGITNYTWTFNDGTGDITLWDVSPSYTFIVPGVFTVTLNVTDGDGNWNTDTMTVTVNDITNPVANAGPDQNVNEGTIVTFDGSASTDNVVVVNYTWTFTDGVTVTLWEVGPTYQFNNVGVFIVTLNVTDAAGNWHTDTMIVTVLDITNPVANAGPDQIVDEGTVVTFDGSASTDNVGVLNYTWTFTDGVPVTLWEVGPAYQFDNPGIYIVTLNITDAAGNWHTDTMTVTVNDITDPVANAGPDQIADEGTIVTFDGSASTDNVGITNYTWTFTDGVPVTLYDVGPTYQFDNVGIFIVTLNVTDAAGNWHTDTMTVTVNDITNPVANAGPDQNVNESTVVTFDGSASTDNVGVVNYTWTFTDGVPVTLWEIGPTYQFNNVGMFIVTLNVTDAAGNWHTDTMTVFVQDATAPTANAGPDQTVDEGDIVTFDGSASTDNVGITNYTWTFNDGTGDITLWGISPTHTFTVPGIYTVTLNITDTDGNWNTDTMTVTVNDITNPVANAGPDQNVNEGTVVTFDGSASTDNVGVVNYTWTFMDGVPVTLWEVGPTYQFDHPGIYIVTLTVTDAAGNWHTDTMTVTVLDITNPVANAGPDQNVNEGTVVTFDGSASTDNMGVVNYTWTFTDGVPVTLYGVGPTYQFNNVGVFLVTLVVTDATGNWHTDTMTVTVNDITNPVANAGPDQNVNEGTIVTFDGSASTDNVGVVNYTWTFTDGVPFTLWGAGPSHQFDNPGIFTVTLTVRDATGNSDTDTLTVTVLDITDPVANAGIDQTVYEGAIVAFDGSASTDNVGVVNYTWTFTDGVSVTLYGVGPAYQFNNLGIFIVTLTVRDAVGNSNSDYMTVEVLSSAILYIQIEFLNGTEVGDVSGFTTDDTLLLFAQGYGASGYIGNVTVNWAMTGGIGVFNATIDTSVTIDLIKPGTGIIIAYTVGGILIDITGNITVTVGAMVYQLLTEQPIIETSADDEFLFTVIATDSDGNAGTVPSVTWSAENGTIAGGLYTPWLVGTWGVSAYVAGVWLNSTITVTAGAIASIIVNPAYAEAEANEAVAFSIAGFDAKGNQITLTGGTAWFLDGDIQASGTISTTVAGNHTVFASHSGFLGIAHLNVSAGAGNLLVIDQTGVTISADQTFTFTVSVLDIYGNTVPGPLPAIAWAAGNGSVVNGLFTPWSSGTWTIYANATGYTGGTAQITVTSGTVTHIVIIPSGSGTRDTGVSAGQSMLFTVSALDQKNNLVSVPLSYLSWITTVGTVSNGFFTAITDLNGAQSVDGTLTVTYTSGTTHIIGSENITVGVGPLFRISIGPAAAVSLNEYHTFTAQGYDIYGNAITGLAFVWGTTGNVGTIGSDGVFRGTSKGLGTLTATSGGITGELPVFVSEPAGIFASWLWLVIILFIVVIILVILLILGRREDVVVVREEPEQEEEPEEETSDISPEEMPDEFNEPLADLEGELDAMAGPPLTQDSGEVQAPDKGPEMTPDHVKTQIAEEMRTERCGKMLSASVVLPDDKEKLLAMIGTGISPEIFAIEIQKAIERRKKKEQEKAVTSDEKAAILEDELVAELAELEERFDNGSKGEDLEDEILKEIEDLEDS